MPGLADLNASMVQALLQNDETTTTSPTTKSSTTKSATSTDAAGSRSPSTHSAPPTGLSDTTLALNQLIPGTPTDHRTRAGTHHEDEAEATEEDEDVFEEEEEEEEELFGQSVDEQDEHNRDAQSKEELR
jgi:hypothetical protein